MRENIIETIGWFGEIVLIVAYALLSLSILKSDSISYQLLNLSGSLGIFVVSWYKKVWQSVSLNTMWGIIALIAIINLLHH